VLTIRNYSKSYNGILVLSVDELTLPQGVYWIKGENGSGKSTLFKSIAGILPFDGQVSFKELDSKKNAVPYRRLINYAEAEPLFPGFLTAKDLIRFIGKTKGASLDQQKTITSVFGVDAFFEKPCETYSSGMMKKLSLVLSFLGSPQVIILDEPFITLDEQARKVLISQIVTGVEQGITFLISSHQTLNDFPLQVKRTYAIHNKTLIGD